MLKNTWIVYVTGSLSGYSLPNEFGDKTEQFEKRSYVRIKKRQEKGERVYYYKGFEEQPDGRTTPTFTVEREEAELLSDREAYSLCNKLRKNHLWAEPVSVSI